MLSRAARAIVAGLCVMVAGLLALSIAVAHPHSSRDFLQARREAEAKAAAFAEPAPTEVALADAPASDKAAASNDATPPGCRLTIRLTDAATGKQLPGLIRVTNLASGKAVELRGPIKRDMNWYAIAEPAAVLVPQSRLKIEALRGLETELTEHEIDVTGKAEATVELPLKRFYDTAARGLVAGNTHLHLLNLTYEQAYRYLQIVPQADALDLVYVSYLRRVPGDETYITNEMVTRSLGGGGDLARLSQHGVLFGNGEEHRHNFGPGGEGYGHVMFLDLLRLIQPVSIGPGIMQAGTDAPPLRQGILAARQDGATIIWCHNKFGFEDVPNWMAGLLDAQNIFDGGAHGSYGDTFYRYLNLGMQVPFSTGTDWFIYDFSRVYVPLRGPLTSKYWLDQLRQGRTFITNGPLIEFAVEGHTAGDVIELSKRDNPSQPLEVTAKAFGRCHFAGLELIHNGKVVHTVPCRRHEGHYRAELKHRLPVHEPGWLAVRIPLEAGTNEFDKPLFAHTSAVYLHQNGQQRFEPEIAQQLIAEMKANIDAITRQGTFANDEERERVLEVHRRGIATLEARLQKYEQQQPNQP